MVELGKLEQALQRLQLFVSQRRLESLCFDLRLTSARYKAVPSHYYTLTYEQRVQLIGLCVCVSVCLCVCVSVCVSSSFVEDNCVELLK